jgi:hypothetical protein
MVATISPMKKLLIALVFFGLVFVLVIAGSLVFLKPRSFTRLPSTLPDHPLPTRPGSSIPPMVIPAFDHIAVIIMENKSAEDIVRNSSAPYINSLIRQFGLAANYEAVAHPSLPNYLALIGGSTFGITSDCTDCYIDSPNLVDRLEQAHKSWKAYLESMPSPCFNGSSGLYAQKHNPFVYFDDVRKNNGRCENIVPLADLSPDLASSSATPNFIWVSPNLCHDMHDCPIKEGDAWLAAFVPPIINSPAFTQQISLLIITWDEGEAFGNNDVPTILIGPAVKRGYTSGTRYTHYSVLHTIEVSWDLMPLTTNDQTAPVMADFFPASD